MKPIRPYPGQYIAVAVIALGAACSSVPNKNSMLDEARSDYFAAMNNTSVVSLASAELKQANDALEQANKAFSAHDSTAKVENFAYIARQRTAIAQEVAKQKAAEIAAANTIRERDQARLEQRTAEAEKAKAAESEAQARARQLEAQLSDLSTKQTDRGLVVTIGDVLFSTNTAKLKPSGLRNIQKLAGVLKQNPQLTMMIEGFTDSTGSATHNQTLSERRANAVLNALMNLGIERQRMTTQGYGAQFPVASNDTAENRQLNRRVEIVLSQDGNQITPRLGASK